MFKYFYYIFLWTYFSNILANEASQVPKAGGPLNNNGRSDDDDLRKSGRTDDTADDLQKSARNNERDENSPGINDILSGIYSEKITFFENSTTTTTLMWQIQNRFSFNIQQ